jgi:hypothetical protein
MSCSLDLVASGLLSSFLVVQEGELLAGAMANSNGFRELPLPEIGAEQVGQIQE